MSYLYFLQCRLPLIKELESNNRGDRPYSWYNCQLTWGTNCRLLNIFYHFHFKNYLKKIFLCTYNRMNPFHFLINIKILKLFFLILFLRLGCKDPQYILKRSMNCRYDYNSIGENYWIKRPEQNVVRTKRPENKTSP
jgi:hypothetical protein